MPTEIYKYYAFISYNSRDTKWGKRLQRKLENYSMPTTLCSEHGWKRKPMKPVFFAPTDIQPGGLTAELQERLRASQHLIVICSPNSARSKWVGQEISYFHSLGRTEHIHFFIVDGVPHSGNEETECFNPIIDQLGLPEILGANIHERVYRWPWLNKERAYVQLITKLLGVEFDTIWQRHKRLLVRRIVAWTVGVLAVLAALVGVWVANQPINVEVGLNEASEHNSNLPPLKDAVVTMALDNEIKTDTVASIDDKAVFVNLPHGFLGKNVDITVVCKDFVNVDTTVVLTGDVTLDIRRDASVYGNVKFGLWNPDKEQMVAGCEVQLEGHHAVSDEDGVVSFVIPLPEQKTSYAVSAEIPLMDSIVYLPCGDDAVLLAE